MGKRIGKRWRARSGRGPVVLLSPRKYRGLAEIEVWTIGDNIGTGVLERGRQG